MSCIQHMHFKLGHTFLNITPVLITLILQLIYCIIFHTMDNEQQVFFCNQFGSMSLFAIPFLSYMLNLLSGSTLSLTSKIIQMTLDRVI
jgi:hypothetical protein